MKELLIIFTKNPEKGKVKTRLAATLGDEEALDVYKLLLNHTLSITQSLAIDKAVYYGSSIPSNDLWSKKKYIQALQHGDSLGDRMKKAVSDAFLKGYEKVVIIGCDCYQLQTHHIQSAFEKLDENDAVIGPANDGGYYLLGMNNNYPIVFDQKQWSTPSVFKDTLNDFSSLNLDFFLLPQLIDVDTEADWIASK